VIRGVFRYVGSCAALPTKRNTALFCGLSEWDGDRFLKHYIGDWPSFPCFPPIFVWPAAAPVYTAVRIHGKMRKAWLAVRLAYGWQHFCTQEIGRRLLFTCFTGMSNLQGIASGYRRES